MEIRCLKLSHAVLWNASVGGLSLRHYLYSKPRKSGLCCFWVLVLDMRSCTQVNFASGFVRAFGKQKRIQIGIQRAGE